MTRVGQLHSSTSVCFNLKPGKSVVTTIHPDELTSLYFDYLFRSFTFVSSAPHIAPLPFTPDGPMLH